MHMHSGILSSRHRASLFGAHTLALLTSAYRWALRRMT